MSDIAGSGRIITFYSYKGGTGRSMALANVAWILASNGKRVLAVDWDLEAPGLHRYFKPFLLDKNLTSSEGVLDMVLEYATEAITPIEKGAGKPVDWFLPYANILRYATSLRWKFPAQGRLDFMPAGKQSPSYGSRMNSFDWRNFYERLGGSAFLDEVVARMREEYDYVLVDSRTGVSDTSGICTIKMPDILVVCFTLNNQGIEGAASVASSVFEQRGKYKVPIYPVSMRIENAEKNKLQLRKRHAQDIFGKFPVHLSKEDREKYFEDVKVPYIPFYAYEEILATFGDTPGESHTVLAAMEKLTGYITEGDVRQWDPPSASECKTVLAEYEGDTEAENETTATTIQEPVPATHSIVETPAPYVPKPSVVDTVFLSYAQKDEKLVKQFINHLANLKRQGFITDWFDREITPGEVWSEEIDQHLETAKIILLFVSPDFVASEYSGGAELRRAMQRHAAGEARVIPVLLRAVDWQVTPFHDLQALPKDARPVTSHADLDQAFLEVAKGVRKAVEQLTTSVTTASAVSETTSLYIPRPPVVGFVARRDSRGQDIVQKLREELDPRSKQFVALWGPGGVGKTSLAAEAVRGLLGAFSQRVVWVNLAARANLTLGLLLDEIATQLGRPDLRSLAPQPKEEQVRVLIVVSPALIVLDGFETIAVDEQKRISDFLGQRAPCSVLITTRQRVEYARSITIGAMSPAEALEFLQLLIAQTLDPQIFAELDRDRIIKMAEGNPLILQWVVAQIDMAQEPKTVLEELAQGESDAVQRVFDRSFNLSQVGDDGRAVLLALSLFVPSAARPALAEVAGFGSDLVRLNEAVKSLRALWLIGTTERNERLTLEGLTRSLSRARLERQADLDAFRGRFISHFLEYARAYTQPTPEDFDALEAEKDNLISTLEIAFDMGRWEGVLTMMGDTMIPRMLYTRGYWDEALSCDERAVMAAQKMKDDLSAAYFSGLAATIRIERGEYSEARKTYEAALTAFEKAGSEPGVATALHQLGRIAQSQGDFMEAREFYNRSLEIRKRLNEQSSIAAILRQLGMLAQVQGDLAEARQLYEKSLAINRKLDDQVGIASTVHRLGTVAQDEGRLDEAQQLYLQSLEINTRLGNQSGIATTFYELGVNAHQKHNWKEARRLYTESLEISRKLGNQNGIASALHQLGKIASEERDKVQAARLWREALAIFEKLGSPYAETTRQQLEKIASSGV